MPAQDSGVVGKTVAQGRQHVGRPHRGRHPVAAVFGHFIAGAGYRYGRQRGDVEGIFVVSAGAHDVYGFEAFHIERHGQLEQRIAEALQFLHGRRPHLEYGDETRHLHGIIPFAGNFSEHRSSFLAAELFVVEQTGEDVFHG